MTNRRDYVSESQFASLLVARFVALSRIPGNMWGDAARQASPTGHGNSRNRLVSAGRMRMGRRRLIDALIDLRCPFWSDFVSLSGCIGQVLQDCAHAAAADRHDLIERVSVA